MARLTILIHRGCLSDTAVERLAEDIRHQLPDWTIELIPAELSTESSGLVAFPAFLVDGIVVATGLPEREWLLKRLRAHR
ncbi:MAG: hypothetical protein JSR62_11145 [Nitrospira sp.]|nr:hypothetical protein [Nitrospira sp.]